MTSVRKLGLSPFNRTTVECKSTDAIALLCNAGIFNRTTVECKSEHPW